MAQIVTLSKFVSLSSILIFQDATFTGRCDSLGENRFGSYDLVDLHFSLAYLRFIKENHVILFDDLDLSVMIN